MFMVHNRKYSGFQNDENRAKLESFKEQKTYYFLKNFLDF
jgi:hypothetical protein